MEKINSPAGHRVRLAAHAGRFYPADPDQLRTEVLTLLASARSNGGPSPKAIIAPHAGYMYSGPIAASAYAQLERARDVVRRVVLVGPSHFASFDGLAVSNADAFATPLGSVQLDREGLALACALPRVCVDESAHRPEHSLEVHLPFLQSVLSGFRLVPVLVGHASEKEVGQVIDALWGGPETRVVISSDLSHYHDHARACALDSRTACAIETLRSDLLSEQSACGWEVIAGMLYVARRRGLGCRIIDLRNSGDTAGHHDRVVGYGAFVFDEPSAPRGQTALEGSQR